MDKEEIILIGMATAERQFFSPVRVQKLFFLIDKNIAESLGGPFFDFEPYNYGPFDKSVYTTLESMSTEGFIEIVPEYTWKSYRLTEIGQAEGTRLLAILPVAIQKYIGELSIFVRSMSFSQLVSAIYKAYPEMRTNSVFQE